MNWGKGIILSFGVFIALIVTMVVISIKQNINLVANDYYVQEIAYQDQIDRMQNHRDSNLMKITHDRSKHNVILSYGNSSAISGDVLFFRPSDASKDIRTQLKLSADREQVFDLRNMQPGLWKIKITWKEGGEEYYYEQAIVI